MKTLAVIPARYDSTRMPGKPLLDILGKPMIWWVYMVCKKYRAFADVVVAADDERIINACLNLNIRAMLTSKKHDTPTSRLCEVADALVFDLYMLVMGDEPLVDEKCFDLILPRHEINEYYVAALTNVLKEPSEVIDSSNQKVVTNEKGDTLFISRSPIPYPKGTLNIEYEKVTGVQLFSRKALRFYESTPKTKLEKIEENDLMRFVEYGIPVKMFKSPYKTISVDTPKDLDAVRAVIKERMMQC